MADHFEEVIGLRVSALEAHAAVEAEAVKEHFAELQSFITFSLTRQAEGLRDEFRREISRLDNRIDRVEQRLDRVEQRLDQVEQRLDRVEQRLDQVEQRLDRVEQRLGALERRFENLEHKADVHYEAIKLILGDILDRLPPRHA